MLQPIVPLIEYYSNKEYIASVLCENRDKPALACNGKCYLEKQLKKASKQDTHDHSVPQIDLSKYPVSPLNYTNYNINEFIIFKVEKFSAQELATQNFYTSLLKPPQLIS
ncbi:MAG: hypothetical protein PSN34_06580 [Urechidicola sp.]|nr:hypothetical protein [Urechidicola sp.]